MEQKEKDLLMSQTIDNIMVLSWQDVGMRSMQNIMVHCIMASCNTLEDANGLLNDVLTEVEELDDMGLLVPFD